MSNRKDNAGAFFDFVTTWPKSFFILSLLVIAGLTAYIEMVIKLFNGRSKRLNQ